MRNAAFVKDVVKRSLNRAIVAEVHGQVMYVRSRTWWSSIKARVVFTTTETLPANIAKAIFAKSRRGRVVRWDGSEFFRSDPVQLKVDDRVNKTNIDKLTDELLLDPKNPTDLIISDMVQGLDIVTHARARGSNDLSENNIATTLTSIGEVEYKELNAIAQFYGLDDVIAASYMDRYNQAVGRNRGLRGDTLDPKQHEVYITPRLLKSLGGITTFQSGQYPSYLVP